MLANIRSIGSTFGVTAVMATLIVRCVADISAQLASEAQVVEELTGTYVEALERVGCEARAVDDFAASTNRAVKVLSSRGGVSLRMFPGGATRLLRLQRKRVPANVMPKDGLARWREHDLVIRSAAPALPLWSRPHLPGGGTTLVETFSFSRGSLTYGASYQDDTGTSVTKPFELALGKCEADVN